jgi:hypothetical protein
MAAPPSSLSCPFCRKVVPPEARQCPHCDQWLYEDDGSLPQGEPLGAVDFLIPTRVSGWSMLACYLGLVGFCLPFIGLLFAVPAVICGIVALRRRRKVVSYGAVTSNIRAIIGLVLGSLSILLWAGWGLMLLVDMYRRGQL